MVGKTKGFNPCLKEKVPHCLVFHCMTRHQALASKHLSDELNEMLKMVVKTATLLKLCEDEAYQILLFHTEVCWLSRGQVLVCFIELKGRMRTPLFLQPSTHWSRICAFWSFKNFAMPFQSSEEPGYYLI